MARVTINVGVLKVEFDSADFGALRRSRRVLFGGPCVILCRQWGRALDAGQNAIPGTKPVVWDTHALPWQQWLLHPDGDPGSVRIESHSAGLSLSAAGRGDWSPVRLERPRHGDSNQLWRLQPTADGSAYLIENVKTGKALDAAHEPQNGFEPHLWEPHWESWQQWVIARLPLANPTPARRTAVELSTQSS